MCGETSYVIQSGLLWWVMTSSNPKHWTSLQNCCCDYCRPNMRALSFRFQTLTSPFPQPVHSTITLLSHAPLSLLFLPFAPSPLFSTAVFSLDLWFTAPPSFVLHDFIFCPGLWRSTAAPATPTRSSDWPSPAATASEYRPSAMLGRGLFQTHTPSAPPSLCPLPLKVNWPGENACVTALHHKQVRNVNFLIVSMFCVCLTSWYRLIRQLPKFSSWRATHVRSHGKLSHQWEEILWATCSRCWWAASPNTNRLVLHEDSVLL